MSGPLDNPKLERFAQEYVACGCIGAEAYRRAYGVDKSPNPDKRAYDLLNKNPDLQRRITELQSEVKSDRIMSANELAEYLTEAARTPVNNIDGDSMFAQEISHTERGTTVKSVSKLRALELLSKIRGYLAPDRLEVTEIREPIAELRKRVKSAKGRHARE